MWDDLGDHYNGDDSVAVTFAKVQAIYIIREGIISPIVLVERTLIKYSFIFSYYYFRKCTCTCTFI